MEYNEDDANLPPSKSARKRAAEDLQGLGKRLVEMKDAKLAALPLSDELRAAIAQAKRIKSHEGLRRQMQFIGKLMREVDAEPIRAALAADEAVHSQATRRFHAAEHWRDRMLRGGPDAVSAFCEAYPLVDAAGLSQLVAEAKERGGSATKDLWRLIVESVGNKS